MLLGTFVEPRFFDRNRSMMELEIGGQRYAVPTGELIVGSDSSSAICLSGEGVRPRHAIVQGASDGTAAARQAVPDAEVLLNGVRLGAEPSPVLHGDKLQVGTHEILVTDPRRSGSTQFVNAADIARMVGGARPGAAHSATAATGGRLVCLTDGREYTIGTTALVFGREAGCDVVVPNKDVSRRHAEILATPQGYVVVDSSTNGTFVNSERIVSQRVLARADVIRIGDHDFRFYADAALASASAAPVAAAAAPAPVPAAPPQAAAGATPRAAEPSEPAPAGAEQRLFDTMHGVPLSPLTPPKPAPVTARASASVPTLASFLVRSGGLKGSRLPVRVPVVNIGRAEYNDLVVPDESVSTTHAKLQHREELWILTDLGSTNGTFVDGERISGEAILSPGASVRVGEVSLMFEPTDDEAQIAKGAGTKVLTAMPMPPAPPRVPDKAPAAVTPPESKPEPQPEPSRPVAPPARPQQRRPPVVIASPPAKRGVPSWVLPVVVVAVIAAVVAALLFKR
jgi:pSer/pThr/pTyr-binding forkhead associated (FHA) protein